MSFSLWPSSSGVENSTSSATHETQPLTPALDFIQVLHSSTLEISHYRELVKDGFFEVSASVGSGGQAVVELSRRPGIVIKRSRRFRNGESSHVPHTDRELSRMTLELRILASDYLRSLGLFVKVMGLCYEESIGSLDPFGACQFHLLLEYSELGDMASFLRRNGQQLDPRVKVNLVYQVSRGLAILHQESICHGDLKVQNVLVFNGKDGGYVAKLADFGLSLYSYYSPFDSNPDTFDYPLGTPLLNAPEVRTRDPSTRSVDIPAVIRADTFSFGLLLWEAINDGQSYFNMAWLDTARASKSEFGTEEQIAFLSTLPCNGLLMHGEEFLAAQNMDEELLQRILRVFHASLQDDPLRRQPMLEIWEIFLTPKAENDRTAFNKLQQMLRSYDTLHHGFKTWKTSFQETEILDYTCLNLPENIQRRALDEFKMYATSYLASDDFDDGTRKRAGLNAAECYLLAFGTSYDSAEALRWLKVASDVTSPLCLSRISETLESPPKISGGSEDQLETISEGTEVERWTTSELFLTRKIQHKVASAVTQIRALSPVGQSWLHASYVELQATTTLSIKIGTDIVGRNDMKILDIAALLGENKTLTWLLPTPEALIDPNDQINALRCACIGGNLSSLKIVLDYGVDPSLCGEKNISPLHLLIYVPADFVDRAVSLLIAHGAPTDTRSEATKLEKMGVDLIGTPVEWAVIARNRGLVAALLPHSKGQEKSILRHAISHAYYEIAEDLLSNSNLYGLFTEEDCPVFIFSRPFAHLIAHGRNGNLAVERTIRLCDKHGLINYEIQLRKCITFARTRSCLKGLEVLLDSCPLSTIREGFESDEFEEKVTSILYTAFASAKSNTAWRPILEVLLRNFSITELNEIEELKDSGVGRKTNALYTAVMGGWTLAVRIMLEKGVDIHWKPEEFVLSLFELAVVAGNAEMQAILSEYGGRDDSRPDYNKAPQHYGRWLVLQNMTRRRGFGHFIHSNLSDKDASTLSTISKVHEILILLLMSRDVTNEGKSAKADLTNSLWNEFRALISNELIIRHVDVPDEADVTMLQRAAAFLDVDIIKLLLEAGADANVPLLAKSAGDSENNLVIPFLPFQITCWTARVLAPRIEREMTEKQQQQSTTSSPPQRNLEPTGKARTLRRITHKISNAVGGKGGSKGVTNPNTSQTQIPTQGTTTTTTTSVAGPSSAASSLEIINSLMTRSLDVARVLLRWHQLRDDSRFNGITEFHLQVHIRGVERARMLAEQEGWSMDARASWPGIEGTFTGVELGELPWKDERKVFASDLRRLRGYKLARKALGMNPRDPEV